MVALSRSIVIAIRLEGPSLGALFVHGGRVEHKRGDAVAVGVGRVGADARPGPDRDDLRDGDRLAVVDDGDLDGVGLRPGAPSDEREEGARRDACEASGADERQRSVIPSAVERRSALDATSPRGAPVFFRRSLRPSEPRMALWKPLGMGRPARPPAADLGRMSPR